MDPSIELPDMIADYRRALSPSALSHRVYDNVTLTPGVFTPEQPPTRIQFGAFSAEKAPIDAFRFHRQNSASSLELIYPEDIVKLPGTYIYGGVVQNQYGAFLTESLSRHWFFRENMNLPILWHHIQGHEKFFPFQNEIFSLCGLALGRSKIINQPMIVDRVIVPEPGCVLDCWLAAPQADALNIFPFARVPNPNKRIWISRSKLRDGLGKVQGEELLEAELAEKGWTILAPESHPVWWQLQAMSDAEEIAGFEGSAFHNLILADGCEAQITLYARGEGNFPIMHSLIGSAKRLRQNFGKLPFRHIGGTARTQVVELLDPQAAAEFVHSASSRARKTYKPRQY
jgi:hypothetical protein